MPSVSVGVRIPSSLYEKLVAHTSKVHVSKSDVVISAQKVADLEAKVEELQALVKK